MRTILIAGAVALGIYVIYRCYYILNLDGALDSRLRRGAVILDVRTRPEWARGHIDGAINIPLSELRDARIPIDRDRTVITCCSHGLRSVKALSILRSRGYRNVCNGGAWSDLERRAEKAGH